MDQNKMHITLQGGSAVDRLEMTGLLRETLFNQGFKNICAKSDGMPLIGRIHDESVYSLIKTTHPELFEREIVIRSMKFEEPLGRVKLIAGDGDDVSVVDTRGDVREFLQMASDVGTPDEFTVKSDDPRAIAKAVAEILTEIPTADVRASISGERIDGKYVLSKM